MGVSAWLWIPLLNALVGGATNGLAILLALHPQRAIRLGPLRLQGILPRKAASLAADFSRQVLTAAVTPAALFAPVDPARMAAEAERQLGPRIDSLLDAMLSSVNPAHWARLRPAVREEWRRQLRPATARVTERVLQAVQEDPQRYIDLSALIGERMAADPEILTQIFRSSGRRELRFLVWSGALLGALLGLPIAAFWPWLPYPAYSALGGALVGGLTNWLALLLVFEPRRPRRLGPFTLHGLIHRRQRDTARAVAEMTLQRLISFGALTRHLASRPEVFRELCLRALSAELEQTAGGSTLLLIMALGARNAEQAIQAMTAAMTTHAPPLLAEVELPEDIRRVVVTTLVDSLASLPPETYGELLRSAVRDEEPLLVWSGVLSGAVAGLLGAWLF